jgi:hypothetical protein
MAEQQINSQIQTNNEELTNTITLHDIIRMVIANWYWFVLSTVCCLCAAYYYLASTPKIYSRTATILVKDSRKGRVFPVSRPRKGVREAVLEYRILATAGESSLAEITLHTGRTHQIRVQFASRKHPLYGDGKYGSRQKGSIALQSCGLRFVHPDTGKPMAFSLSLPAAAPWKEFLELGE